jgi:hypothetical protein
LAKAQAKEVAEKEPVEVQYFVRIVEYPLHPNEHYKAYQPEVLVMQGEKVVKRVLVDKKNTFEYAFSKALEYIDNRNESRPNV